MASLKKKIFVTVGIVAFATWMAFNLNVMRSNDGNVDITLSNVEVLAGEGAFPACQKKKLYSGEHGTIPFCVNGECKKVEEYKGTLDVNYCSQ